MFSFRFLPQHLDVDKYLYLLASLVYCHSVHNMQSKFTRRVRDCRRCSQTSHPHFICSYDSEVKWRREKNGFLCHESEMPPRGKGAKKNADDKQNHAATPRPTKE